MTLPIRVNRALGFDPLDAMHRELDGVMNRFFGQQEAPSRGWAPYCVDVREDADHLYVDAELPGFNKDQVEITLESQTLTISAERSESEEKKGDYLLNERRFTRFLRSFTLPPTVDEKHVDAKLADGVLTIMLNKREETKPRRIQVS